MNCQVVQKFMSVYLDGEFDEDDRRDMDVHLAACEACRAQVDYERRFRQAIQSRLPRPLAPEGLRERVVVALNNDRPARRLPRPLVWGSVPAVAALALMITFTWTVTSGFSPLVDQAVAEHTRQPPVEVNSEDSGEVENWFRSKVNFRVTLPRFAHRRLSLVGGRLSNLAERRAALIRYHHDGHRFSLFVVAGTDLDMGGERCQKVRQQEFCLTEVRGYSVVSWRSRGLLYSMVGESNPAELLKVLSVANPE
jgi:anti-sigma factor (TIGR02949 family)